jgi:hypothetical protein
MCIMLPLINYSLLFISTSFIPFAHSISLIFIDFLLIYNIFILLLSNFSACLFWCVPFFCGRLISVGSQFSVDNFSDKVFPLTFFCCPAIFVLFSIRFFERASSRYRPIGPYASAFFNSADGERTSVSQNVGNVGR